MCLIGRMIVIVVADFVAVESGVKVNGNVFFGDCHPGCCIACVVLCWCCRQGVVLTGTKCTRSGIDLAFVALAWAWKLVEVVDGFGLNFFVCGDLTFFALLAWARKLMGVVGGFGGMAERQVLIWAHKASQGTRYIHRNIAPVVGLAPVSNSF